jgi:hypothetical protein
MKTNEEKLAALVAQVDVDDAIEQVERMSDAEIEAELADAGIDLEAVQRRMQTLLQREGVLTRPARRVGRWVALAVAAAILVAIAWKWPRRPGDSVASPHPSASADAGRD